MESVNDIEIRSSFTKEYIDSFKIASKINRELRAIESFNKSISDRLFSHLKQAEEDEFNRMHYNCKMGIYSTSYFEKLKKNGGGIVYFIGNKENGRVKIGYTASSAFDRLKVLRGASGCDLCVLAEFKYNESINAQSIEKSLHKWYNDKRHIGEWFNLNNKDYQEARLALKRLNGTFTEYEYKTEEYNPFK